MFERIETILKMLSENPKAGRLRHELAPALRSFPVGSYVLFYRQNDAGMEIVRVLHGRLDIQADHLL